MNGCRHIVKRLLAPLAASVALAFAATPAYAVHDDGIFQIDGDAFHNTCGTSFGGLGCIGDDWSDLYTCSGTAEGDCSANTPGVGNNAKVISDFVYDPAPLTIFTGGGSKDEADRSSSAWTNGSVPDKDDLVEACAA